MRVTARVERWPIAGTFAISRGAKTEADVVVAEVTDGPHRGRGECVPYPRYGETVHAVRDAIARIAMSGLDRATLRDRLPAGAARNALDCALWDLDAKRAGQPVHALLGLQPPQPRITAYTISLDRPAAMATAAARAAQAGRTLLKIKLGRDGDGERLAAVRAAAPSASLIVDANEGWTAESLAERLADCARAGVALVEQPLPAARDEALGQTARAVPVCADESVHDVASLRGLAGKYDAVNIKLDKAGGLTEALALAAAARRQGLGIMIGCMVATSLAMAPAMLLAQDAAYVDLDGPLLLARDRPHGLRYDGGTIYPPTPELWG